MATDQPSQSNQPEQPGEKKRDHRFSSVEAKYISKYSDKKYKDSLLNWWLGSAIVGADIGTSVFYSTALIMPFVGMATPLIILVICLLMWLFKSTYEEGCSVSPFNGGAYIMVLQTVGRRLALVVGALTILSYLATAAVSSLSGAFYLDSFDNLSNMPIEQVLFLALIPVVVFGFLNIVGIREPATIVFFIAMFHFCLLLYMDLAGLIIAYQRKIDLSLVIKDIPSISPWNMLQGFAAAFLGITGFESAAQIVEQLKTPTWKTLKKVYLAIVILVGITAPITSLLCLSLLSPAELETHKDHLLSGLAYLEGGQLLLEILVVDAALTLFAAVNTAYVGCIGLCTTMAKQGNLPALLLRRWAHQIPLFQGYPYVVLPFMLIASFLILILPGRVDALAQVYGMAFLAVMASFCLGVILLRFKMPLKVKRAPFKTKLTINFAKRRIPLPALIGLISLLVAEFVLISTADQARDLGLEILLVILLIMVFYRLGALEERLEDLPDLRLGLGCYKDASELPDDLPVYVLCTAGAKVRNLADSLLKLLEREDPGPKEIIIYHAEKEEARRGMMHELLQRVVSQQLAPSFDHLDMILTVKILPEKLVEGLIYLKRAHHFDKVFVGTGHDPDRALGYVRELEENIGVPVINIGNIFMDQKVPRFAKPKD